MKKIFFKFFILFFTLFICTIQAFAFNSNTNSLSKIVIDPLQANSYKLNLYFNGQYSENAFIQKVEKDSYYVFLPNSKMKSRNIKVSYKNKKDKENINIKIEPKSFVPEDPTSNYIRLHVTMNGNYSLRLLSKVQSQSGIFSALFNTFNLVILVLLALGIFAFKNLNKIPKKSQLRSIASVRKKIRQRNNNFNKELKEIAKENNVSIPQVEEKRTLIKTSENQAFSCFDIPVTERNKTEFKDTLKTTSVILKEKTAKSKQSNPITKSITEDSSELKLPTVDEIKKEEVKEEEVQKKAELISELKITPTKGFYLTTVDETFALFGYIGDNVYLLTKFDDLSQINLQARFYDRSGNSDIYIIRLDSYRAMIEISDKGMKELAVL